MKITILNECYYCIHKRNVPGNAHITCVEPDSLMEGSENGIKNGWFFYPIIFDPIWKTKKCNNFKLKENA